jgi:hypothetical protein
VMEAPSSKRQVPKKLQAPSSKVKRRKPRCWDLELGLSLELGAWDLELSCPA